MHTITIPKKEYNDIIERQSRIEEELDVVKKIMQVELEEKTIKPSIQKRWDRISRDVDRGQGRFFTSEKEARRWLKNL